MTRESFYNVNLTWNEGRKGTLASPMLEKTIETATPPEFPGGVEGFWSPEHLFIASVSSCLMTTFLAIAENSRLEFSYFEVKATGKLEIVDGRYMISVITLFPRVTVNRKSDRERAIRIMEKSESACLISNSIKTKVKLVPQVVTGQMV